MLEENKNKAILLSIDQEQIIIEAIKEAERNTSGEIRIHISNKEGSGSLVYAQNIFQEQNMHATKYRNGILLHISPIEKTFSVVGDQGIHQKVKQEFWDKLKEAVVEHFKQGDFYEGILFAVKQTGEKLNQYFPIDEDDKNELSDEISYS